MKKFSDSLRLKEGSAKTVEKAKLQINENVQLLNTIVATVNVFIILNLEFPGGKKKIPKINWVTIYSGICTNWGIQLISKWVNEYEITINISLRERTID